MDAARQFCRNPHCRMKLKQPEANPRSAFCSRGCHASFYRKRCMACELPMERRSENQLLCGRRKCRTEMDALRRHGMLGRYVAEAASGTSIKPGISPLPLDSARSLVPETPKAPLKTSIKSGIKTGLGSDRAWLQVAGPKLTGAELRLATVGAPIEAADRKAKAAAPVQGDVMPVNVIGSRRSQTRSSAAADHLNRPSHQEGAA
jgi:hypothetical protein